MILRLTQNLNTRLKGGSLATLPLHENPLLDWSVRSFAVQTTEYLLLCNTPSFYCAVLDPVSSDDVTRYGERVLGVVLAVLEAVGCSAVGRGVGSVQLAKFLDRSVTGSMNELAVHAAALLDDRSESLQQVGVRLNEVLLSALRRGGQKYGTPREAFAELVTGVGG